MEDEREKLAKVRLFISTLDKIGVTYNPEAEEKHWGKDAVAFSESSCYKLMKLHGEESVE